MKRVLRVEPEISRTRVSGSARGFSAIQWATLWLALSRQKSEREAHRRRLRVAPELQRNVNTLPRRKHTVRQKYTNIRISRARSSACVGHFDLERQTAGDHE